MKKLLLGIALGAAGLFAAGSTARADGSWSVGVNVGGPVYSGSHYYRPAPVYCAPARPVYYRPRPVCYAPAPVYYYPRYRALYAPGVSHGGYWRGGGGGYGR